MEIILFGLSVCADCFAVSLCSSIGLKKRDAGTIVKIALCFAIIQTAFLLVGWACGDVLTSLINKVAKWEALALLVYVGGSMIYSALFSKKSEKSDLNGLKNIALAGNSHEYGRTGDRRQSVPGWPRMEPNDSASGFGFHLHCSERAGGHFVRRQIGPKSRTMGRVYRRRGVDWDRIKYCFIRSFF